MFTPSIFGESLFDDWMDDFEKEFDKELRPAKNPLYGKHAKNMMKTDVKETEKGYEVDIDLPGFKKDEIQLELNDGYLTISAEKGLDKDEEDEKKHYLRRERYAGGMSRSFYIGEGITEEDIHAKYEYGILKLSIPKEQPKAVPEKHFISIEG